MEELLEINPPSLLDIGCWAVGSSCWDEGAGYGAAVLDERAPLSAILENFSQSGASLFNNAAYQKDHGSAYELGNSDLCFEFNKGFNGRRNMGDMVAPYPPSPYPSIPCFPSTSTPALPSSNSVLAPFPANFHKNSSGFSGSFFLENPPYCSSSFNPPLCSNPNLISMQRTEHLESKKWSLNFNFKPFGRAPPLLEKGNSAISITEIICKSSMARNRAEEFRKRSAESSPLLATTKKLRSSSAEIEAKKKSKQRVANDPQSVAARQRRERVSERLKILQELVPYGSKVDLVTMLEKAINYVKFLQLQVQFLTTDEYWPKHPNIQAQPKEHEEDTKLSQHEHGEDEEPQKKSSTT